MKNTYGKILEKKVNEFLKKKTTKKTTLELIRMDDKLMLERCVIKDFDKNDIKEYNRLSGNKHQSTEYDIKMFELKEHAGLYETPEEKEHYAHLLDFVRLQRSVVRMTVKDVFNDIQHNYTPKELNNILVAEIAIYQNAYTLEDIEYAYKQYRLAKNRELIGEDFYKVCFEVIEKWYTSATNTDNYQKTL